MIQNREHNACATRSSLPADRFHTETGGRFVFMHLSMLSPRLGGGGGGGGGGGRATHGKLTERAFPRVGNLTWPPSWKTERNWK